MPADQYATLLQTMPRLWTIARNSRPTYAFDTVQSITGDFLEREGVRGVLWDVDGTIMSYHAKAIDETFGHLHALISADPDRHAVLSNCDEPRFRELGDMLPELPILRAYATPSGPVFRHTHRGRDTHSHEEIARLLQRGARQIRKPSGALVRYGMEILGLTDPQEVLMVGDQYLTDVASANLAGARSVKVRTWRRDTFPFSIRTSQRLERLLYLVMRPFQ